MIIQNSMISEQLDDIDEQIGKENTNLKKTFLNKNISQKNSIVMKQDYNSQLKYIQNIEIISQNKKIKQNYVLSEEEQAAIKIQSKFRQIKSKKIVREKRNLKQIQDQIKQDEINRETEYKRQKDAKCSKYLLKDEFIKGGEFVKIVEYIEGRYIVKNELIKEMMEDLDKDDGEFIQIIGFLGVNDQGKGLFFQELLGTGNRVEDMGENERKGLYIYSKPQISFDHQGQKIINFILDIDECSDYKLLSIVPLLCSHLVYINVNQQIKKEKLQVISKKMIGLLELFSYFMDIVDLESNYIGEYGDQDYLLANDIEKRTKQVRKYMPDLVWMLQNDLSAVPASISDQFDTSLLEQFFNRDFSNNTEKEKILQVFNLLFPNKQLINFPSDYQTDQALYQKQLACQIKKLKENLIQKMKIKKNRFLGNIRTFEFNYQQFTTLLISVIKSIDDNENKFNLGKVFEVVIENECINTYNQCIENYEKEIRNQFSEDKPFSFNQLLIIFSEIRYNCLQIYNERNSSCRNYAIYYAIFMKYQNDLEKFIQQKEQEIIMVNQQLQSIYDQSVYEAEKDQFLSRQVKEDPFKLKQSVSQFISTFLNNSMHKNKAFNFIKIINNDIQNLKTVYEIPLQINILPNPKTQSIQQEITNITSNFQEINNSIQLIKDQQKEIFNKNKKQQELFKEQLNLQSIQIKNLQNENKIKKEKDLQASQLLQQQIETLNKELNQLKQEENTVNKMNEDLQKTTTQIKNLQNNYISKEKELNQLKEEKKKSKGCCG